MRFSGVEATNFLNDIKGRPSRGGRVDGPAGQWLRYLPTSCMALTNAQKQARYRERRKIMQDNCPEVIEGALLRDAERAERDELSFEERGLLADKLVDVAMRHLWLSHKLAKIAEKIRPSDWIVPGAPGR